VIFYLLQATAFNKLEFMKNSPVITIIGAGGLVFPVRLCIDIFSFPELQRAEVRLMDIDAGRVERTAGLVRRLVKAHKLPARVEAGTDQRAALDGADFVIVAFQVGGLKSYKIDKEIPLRFGIDQCVGDTLNPGGIFRGLRSIPVFQSLARDMHEVCPRALMLNYANPMAMNCWAMNNTGIRAVGLCHSVQGTTRMLASQIEVPYEELSFKSYGINHQAWITEFRQGGVDLYPELRRVMMKKFPSPSEGRKHGDVARVSSSIAVDHGEDVYYYERVRTEIMRTFGFFHTESSHHGSEYTPWFRKDAATIDGYIKKRWDYYEFSKGMDWKAQASDVTALCSAEKALECSEEYGAPIIHSMVSGQPRVIYGNVPNGGAPGTSPACATGHLIPNLPRSACVEVACLVDRNGIQPTIPGELPPQCAALNRTNINVQELTVLASETGDPSIIEQAMAMDPLTGALLTLPRIRELTKEMFRAHRRNLPQFKTGL
jgi:alpha-galactosidase